METMLQAVKAANGAEQATAVNPIMRNRMLSAMRSYNEQRTLEERLRAKGDYENADRRSRCAEKLETEINEASDVARILSAWHYLPVYWGTTDRYTELIIVRTDCPTEEQEYERVEV